MKTLKKLVIPNKVRNLIKFNRTVVIFLSFTMIILSNGASAQKVGITDDSAEPPTFAPKSLLHVHHELTTGSIFQITNSTSGDLVGDGFLINLTTSNKIELINQENAGMSFRTNNTERLTILSDGKVGIGTISPESQLHLTDDLQIGTDAVNRSHLITMWSENTYQSDIKFMEANVYGMGIRYVASDNKLYIDRYPNSASPIAVMTFVRDNGRVGIGTTAPAQKLHVVGNIRATSLESGTNGAIVQTNTSGDMALTNFTGNAN